MDVAEVVGLEYRDVWMLPDVFVFCQDAVDGWVVSECVGGG